VPIYNLATREDHIAPAKSVMFGSKYFGGRMRFVLAGSGHIAGVINPPNTKKYQYWTGRKTASAKGGTWRAKTQGQPGAWGPDWLPCLRRNAPAASVPGRIPGTGKLAAMEDAPGGYVKVRD